MTKRTGVLYFSCFFKLHFTYQEFLTLDDIFTGFTAIVTGKFVMLHFGIFITIIAINKYGHNIYL